MKRLVLIAIAWLMCMSTYAQAYEVDFSVDKEKTTATYKLKNNTKFMLTLLKGHFTDLKSYCTVYYISSSGLVDCFDIDVIPDKNAVMPIKPGATYLYEIDLKPYKKENHIIKLEGVFTFVYQKPTKELVPERIERTIEFE
ncbi:hypothetical protein [Hallella bergensis]|uniref:hypothetical protein n=1 Tax=Hallella bergensis TaxID=242750 RepID=UPI003990A509